MAGYRIDRVTEDIHRELCDIVRGLKDPRISGFLTVVRVEVSNDLSYAKVYVSAMEGLAAAQNSVKGLKSAAGYIRRELSSRLSIRKTPELRFIADDSIAHGAEIASLLNEGRQSRKNKNAAFHALFRARPWEHPAVRGKQRPAGGKNAPADFPELILRRHICPRKDGDNI